MNTLDIVLCCVLGFLTVRGFFRGLIREVAAILGLLLGYFLANVYHPELALILEPRLGGPGFAKLAAYLAIFLGTVAAIFIIASLLRKILKLIMLGWLDSLAGGGTGFLKGALLCSIIVMALTAFLPAKSDILANSMIVPYVNEFNSILSQTLPKEMRDQFLERSQALEKEWEAKLLNQLKEIKETTGGKK